MNEARGKVSGSGSDKSNAIESDELEELEEEMDDKLLTLKEDLQNVSRDGTHDH